MKIEILHTPDCPNWHEAGRLAEQACARLGLDARVSYRPIETAEQAARAAFAGSPTVLADGADLFPPAGSGGPLALAAEPSLACRVYRVDGALAGLPTLAQMVEALGRRATSS